MAVTTKKVFSDTPSETVESIRKQLNLLLDAVDASSDYATLKSGILAACSKILLDLTNPAQPTWPVTPTSTT